MALKISPPLVFITAAFLMWAISTFVPAAANIPGNRIISTLFVVTGLLTCAAGLVAFLHAGTTVNPHRPDKATSLVTTGIYRYSRNPMYAGFALVLVGWAFYLSNIIAILVLPLYVFYMNRFQIMPEEKILERLFGEKYVTYKTSVRRWF